MAPLNVVDGYLTYIAVPKSGAVQLPHPIGIRKVSFGSGYVVLHTAASDLIGRLCPAGANCSGNIRRARKRRTCPLNSRAIT
jgi:hypothetical protein